MRHNTIQKYLTVIDVFFVGSDRVTLLHEAQIPLQTGDEIRHKEYSDIKMVWRSLSELAKKEVVPTGSIEHLKNFHGIATVHLVNGFV